MLLRQVLMWRRSSCAVVTLSLAGADTIFPYGSSKRLSTSSDISGGQFDTMSLVASVKYLLHGTNNTPPMLIPLSWTIVSTLCSSAKYMQILPPLSLVTYLILAPVMMSATALRH